MGMSIKAVLFDLDGTLLPMDNDYFVKVYFGKLGATMTKYGIEPDVFHKALYAGIGAMQANDGKATNEELFWHAFECMAGGITEAQRAGFDYFYENVFPSVAEVCQKQPLARIALDLLREKGIRTVLATAPVFPETATKQRAAWGEVYFSDFELVTTYENVRHTKPDLAYYRDIVDFLGVRPEECLMVGNDAHDDMVAAKLGMEVFLITDCLINRKNVDISRYPHGSFADMVERLRRI